MTMKMTRTASQYTRNGMTVTVDWVIAKRQAFLRAVVSTDEGLTISDLSQDETSSVICRAEHWSDYAKIYHDMIS